MKTTMIFVRRDYTPHSCPLPVSVCLRLFYCLCLCSSRSASALRLASPGPVSFLPPLPVFVYLLAIWSRSRSLYLRLRLVPGLDCSIFWCAPVALLHARFVFPLLPLLSTLVLLGARNLRIGVADARSSPPFACLLARAVVVITYLPTYLPAPRPPTSSLSARAHLCRAAPHLILISTYLCIVRRPRRPRHMCL